ncbi:hypothetical protein LCGC14_1885300 [marine sediment metagenome]|uniref:Uncharacterized protein n=1 Tax=marine sediment metagenome TaxID=412755 RepID=A0A0F9G155_9ZZZZ
MEKMRPKEFKAFTLFLRDLEEILGWAYEDYTIIAGSEGIHITLGEALEVRGSKEAALE